MSKSRSKIKYILGFVVWALVALFLVWLSLQKPVSENNHAWWIHVK